MPTKGGAFRKHDQGANKVRKTPQKLRRNQQNKVNKPNKPGPSSPSAKSPAHPTKKPQVHHQAQHQEPTIPFSPSDAILLIGEGDLSFAASLITHHNCTNVTATVLEKTPAELTEKYPQAAANISQILSDARPKCKILYNVDARKMAPFTARGAKGSDPAGGAMDRIIFNFPHVGGKSTDVNRQVRYNQEMLVDFFKRAVPSLAPGGKVVVTLFEGEPYSLWNVRDLARHCGLQVETSFRFQAGAYPGYRHARTLGVLRSRSGEVTGGGWKGEDRLARSYVFRRKGEEEVVEDWRESRKKRNLADEESSDED